MKRGTIAAAAAATLALVGTPALVGNATAAPNGNASLTAKGKAHDAAPVKASKWNSYAVVMEGEPLVKSFDQADLDSAKAQRARDSLELEHVEAVREAGVSTDSIVHNYTNTINGFSVVVSRADAEKIAKSAKVLAVIPDELQQKQAAPSGSDQIKSAPGQTLAQFLGLGSSSNKGDGELLGVIDTGIWPEHPSFADDGTYPPLGHALDESDRSACDFGNTDANPDDAAFECNNKLVGAREFLDTYTRVVGTLSGEFDSARDDDGHGTHTASTAAGNADVDAWIYDESRTIDTTSGVAPRAQIIAYKALGSLGGFSTDLAAAIDQAVEDGVDVINYSIGGGPGLGGWDAASFFWANYSGVHVATSAGNSGPGDATIGGPADLPWVTTVGASTQPRFYSGTVKLWDGGRAKGSVIGSSVTLGSSRLGLVDAANASNPLCLSQSELADNYVAGGLGEGEAKGRAQGNWNRFTAKAKGNMVLCWRGQIGRSAKSLHVMQAGGKAMVLSNQNDVDNYFTDNFRVPTVMVDKTEGDIVAKAATSPRATAQIVDTAEIDSFTPAPSMAVFSSRGPNPTSAAIIKPDITAPGVQVLAGASPMPVGDDYEPGQLFQAIAGTSMSSPVMAGIFLLMDQAHPSWTPSAVKSAVMTTAYQDVRDNDRTSPAGPFDFGSGHVSDPATAADPGLVYDVDIFGYMAFACTDPDRDVFFYLAGLSTAYCDVLPGWGYPVDAVELNYPTIGLPAVAGSKTVTRTVTNVGSSEATYTASFDNPPGMEVSVSPSSLTIAAGDSASFEVTVTNRSVQANSGWVFGALTWSDGTHDVRSNIAAYATPFDAAAQVSGSGASGSVDIPVSVGFNGTYVPVPAGLAPNDPFTGQISRDSDDSGSATFNGCTASQSGVSAQPMTVTADTAYLRISMTQPPSPDDDIDLYLCQGDTLVASSTKGGTSELIELFHPEAGDYVLYVHGWQVEVDNSDFTVDHWQVVTGEGGLSVDPTSVDVSVGDVVDVTAAWADAPAGESYGMVDHTWDGETYGQTVVKVTN